jgi:hypothetical protein
MSRSISLRLWAALALSLLTACGNASAPSEIAPTALSPARAPTSRPIAVAPAPSSVLPTIATNQPAPVTIAAQPTTGVAEATIPEGVTPEGYHVLGRLDAPVTLTMYSDFL